MSSQRDRVCVISPHLDDAVLSLGQSLAGWDRPLVVTVFTDAPPVERRDGWNHATTGAPFAPDTQAARRREDAAALDVLGADAHWLGEHEAEYRPEGQDVAHLASVIGRFLDDHGIVDVVAPLGLRHPDHLAVADACRLLMSTGPRGWRIAADLPYARTFPDLVTARLAEMTRVGFDLEELGPVPVIGDTKATAVGCYTSQVEAVRSEHPDLTLALGDPERTWRVTPPGGTGAGRPASTVT